MRIEDRLNRAATAVDHQIGAVPMRPAHEVSRRSHTQRTLTYTLAGALAFAFISGSALLFTGGSGTTVPTSPANTSPAPLLSTGLEASSLDWQEVESTVRYLDNAFGWNGNVYALSTIPGQTPEERPEARAIYSSNDGLAWDENLLSDDLWISDIDSHAGTIYAISTAPGIAEPRQDLRVRISSTSDFGNTWSLTDLPPVAVPSSEFGSVVWFSAGTKIAAGPAGVVATVNGAFHMDFAPFIPAEFVSAHHFVEPTDAGIGVHDQRILSDAQDACYERLEGSQDAVAAQDQTGEPATTTAAATATTAAPADCVLASVGVVHTATWAELGYSERPNTSFSHMYVSADGNSFDTVVSPAGVDDRVEELVATNEGFVAVVATRENDRTTRRLWVSTDGRQWEQANLDGIPYIQDIGSFGDRLILVSRSEVDVFRVYSSADSGGTWEEVPLPRLDHSPEDFIGPFPIEINISEHGIVLALISEPISEAVQGIARSQVMMTEDLETWSEVPLSSLGSREGYVNGIVNTEGVVLLGVTYFDGPDRHVTLVGTKG